MRVRMKAAVSGVRDGRPWPDVGQMLDLPDDEAVSLCGNGTAEPVYDPAGDVERAVAPAAETRLTTQTGPTPRTKKRDA